MFRILQAIVFAFITLFFVSAEAEIPRAEITDGAVVVTIPAIDLFGDISRGELTLKPDGTYSYSVSSWGCGKSQFSPFPVGYLEACSNQK